MELSNNEKKKLQNNKIGLNFFSICFCKIYDVICRVSIRFQFKTTLYLHHQHNTLLSTSPMRNTVIQKKFLKICSLHKRIYSKSSNTVVLTA